MTTYPAEASEVLSRMHLGHQLDQLPDDRARASRCRELAEGARNKYFQGQSETMADILLSSDSRYVGVSPGARKRIGQQMWGSSTTAKDLASDEQMFSRWATMYSLGVLADLAVREWS